MPTRVYLLRHAQSADPSVFHGAESDVDLSELGRRQAEAAAGYFAARRIEAVVSSAMRRAVDTATPIARRCGLTLQVEPRLHERAVGAMSGTATAQGPDGPWPATLRRWMAGETGYAPAGAETFDDLRRRLLPAWERVVEGHAGKAVVVVAHGVVCKVLLLSLLPGWGVADWQRLGPIDNVAVHELLCEGGVWQALRVNDRAFAAE